MCEPGLGCEPDQGLCSLWEHAATLARATGQAEGEELGSGLLDVRPHGDRLTGPKLASGGRGEGGHQIHLLCWRRLGPCPR